MTSAGKLVFIHTVPALEARFLALATQRLPGWQLSSIIDESLLSQTVVQGHVGDDVVERLRDHLQLASQDGSDAIVVTCSALGDVVDDLAREIRTPLYRIDRGMAERAVEQAVRIGILATLPTTLHPTTNLLHATARRSGRHCSFNPKLCAGAFDHLLTGDRKTHDEMVCKGFEELSRTSDLVVLAQASMADAIEGGLESGVPYLTSPELGMDYIAASLRSKRKTNN